MRAKRFGKEGCGFDFRRARSLPPWSDYHRPLDRIGSEFTRRHDLVSRPRAVLTFKVAREKTLTHSAHRRFRSTRNYVDAG